MGSPRVINAPEFDFGIASMVRNIYEDTTALLKMFEERLQDALAALQNVSDDMLKEKFHVRNGEKVIYEMPRKVMLRNFAFNHLIHHRGQLSVYLRLLEYLCRECIGQAQMKSNSISRAGSG